MKMKQNTKKLFGGVVYTFTVFIELKILVLVSRCLTFGFLYWIGQITV